MKCASGLNRSQQLSVESQFQRRQNAASVMRAQSVSKKRDGISVEFVYTGFCGSSMGPKSALGALGAHFFVYVFSVLAGRSSRLTRVIFLSWDKHSYSKSV